MLFKIILKLSKWKGDYSNGYIFHGGSKRFAKNLASEDSRRPLTEILNESIYFKNCSKSYILCSVRIDSQN